MAAPNTRKVLGACPGSWASGSLGLWEQRCERAPPRNLSPWEGLFVITAEQLFKQGAWEAPFFLIKCPLPPQDQGEQSGQEQVPWLGPTPSPKGIW